MDIELYKSVVTACLTIAGGVVLLVITQIFNRFVIDPLVDFKRLLGEITYTLIFNAKFLFNLRAMTSQIPEFSEARDQCRVLASRLHAAAAAVPLYGFFVDLNVVPPLSDVHTAARHLTGLSNLSRTGSATPDHVNQLYQGIAKSLRIYVGDGEPSPEVAPR